MLSRHSSSPFLSSNRDTSHHPHLLPPIDHIVSHHSHSQHLTHPYQSHQLQQHNIIDQSSNQPTITHFHRSNHHHHIHNHHPNLQLNQSHTPNTLVHQQQPMSHPQPPINQIRRSASYSTTSNSNRPPPKTSRRQSKLNNLDRRRICEYAAAHPKSTQEDIALQWGIDRSSVSKILKYRDKWLSISPNARAAKVIKHRGGRFPQLETEVVRRCKEKTLSGGFLGDRTIKDVALDVSQEMGLGHGAFKASNGWLDAFKERAQIKAGRFLDLSIIPDHPTHPRPPPLRPHQTNGILNTNNNGVGANNKSFQSFQERHSQSRHGSPIANGDRMALTNITPTKRSKLGVHDENYHSDAMDPLNDEVGEDHDNDEDDEDEVGAEEEDEEDDDDEDEDEEEEEEEEEEEDDDDEEDENDEEDDVGLEDDGDLPSRRTCESQSPERGREILVDSRATGEKKAIFEDEDVDEEDGDRTQGFIPRPSCSNKDHSSDSARVNDSSPRFENQRSVFHLNSSTPTPPLSSPNSSNEDGCRAIKMKDLAESLTSPIVKTKPEDQINRSQTGLEEPPSLPTAHTRSISLSSSMSNSSVTSALSKRPPPPVVDPDEMDGIEHIPSIGDSASNREDVGDSTIMIYQESYSHSPHQNRTHQTVNGATYPFPTSSTPSHTPTAHQYSHHALPNESRFFNQSPYAEYRGSGPDRYRHASSNHSRSSSLSISSLSQQSSIYGGEEQQIRSPSRLSGLKVHPGHQLSSHASQPNFRPPPLRSTPVRRTFPSLRHAMSQPAFHSPTGGSAASQPGSGSSYPPSLPPMSASSTGSQTHQYATFPPQPYSISPISAPPTHHLAHNTNHQHIPFPSRPRLDIQPNCHSRLSGHSTRFSREEESKECSNASGEESDSGFNEALGALETVMRFLQDQPTSFATPRDYMVVGELFGRMKEKKQEMINLGFGSQTSSSSGGRIGSQSCKNHYGGMNKSSANSTTSMSINTGGGVAGGNGLSLVLEDHGHGSSHSVPTRHEVEQDRDDRMEH